MKIYVVQGSTGEYSDHREWLVKAFKSQEKAQDFVSFLDSKLLELGLKYESVYTHEDMEKEEKMMEFDPQFQFDYTGTMYSILEVELEE